MEGHDTLCPYPGDMYDDYDCQCTLIDRVRQDESLKFVKNSLHLPDAIMEGS
jgi:hypothetical protein